MLRKRSAFRHIALALITARMLAFALAPMLELRWVEPQGDSAAVAAVHDATETGHNSSPAHDPATCPACLLLHTLAYEHRVDGLAALLTTTHESAFSGPAQAHSSPQHAGIRSRAPPTFLA